MSVVNTNQPPNADDPGSALSRRAVLKTAAWAAPAIVLATAVPSLAASPPLVGPETAIWFTNITPEAAPATRTLILEITIQVNRLLWPPPVDVTISTQVLVEVYLDEDFTIPFHAALVPLAASFTGEFWSGQMGSNFSHTITDEEWDDIFGPTTTDATLHWRLTVNGVLLPPQGETGFYVPQRQDPSDTNPQTGIVTMNNPDNALIED